MDCTQCSMGGAWWGGACIEYIGDCRTKEVALSRCDHYRETDYQLWDITDDESPPFLVHDFLIYWRNEA